MNTVRTLQGLLLATAAASMFAGAGFATAGDMAGASADGKIHCEGVNSCKGHGDCKGENGCTGKNSCKGQGFLNMSQTECDAAKAAMKEDEMKHN